MSALFSAKTSVFSKFMVCPHKQWWDKLVQKRGQFFWMGIFYGRPLTETVENHKLKILKAYIYIRKCGIYSFYKEIIKTIVMNFDNVLIKTFIKSLGLLLKIKINFPVKLKDH